MIEVFIAVIALGIGLAVGYFLGKSSGNAGSTRVAELETVLQERERAFHDLYARQEEAHRRELDQAESAHREAQQAMESAHEKAMEALKEQFTEASGKMSEQLRNTTEDILRKRQEEFASSSREKLGQILQPLQNSLKSMQDKVAENTTRHNELGGQLSESIKNLLQHTESAQASADRLSGMLKGNTRYQGVWGERVLNEILESLNLKEGIHFETQRHLTDEKGEMVQSDSGSRLKPDVILHLDQNKDVIIDSKVSLSGFIKYMEAETDRQREDALREHIASIENHVKELAKKDYASYVAHPRVRMGYVIMFVPNTSALILATNHKPTLWREAMEKNVYIADEQTLYAALKIVSLTWQQIAQTENHKQVYALAEQMLKRVGAFMKSFTDIGAALEKASKSYDDGLKKLEPGGQSIPQTCRRLIELGAKAPTPPRGVDKELLGISESGRGTDMADTPSLPEE